MSDSKARRLVALAERERDRLTRHLLLAAAFREVLRHEPIVVGGTAQEYWTAAAYHETDLDLCAPVTREDQTALRRLGFRKVGRHWERPGLAIEWVYIKRRIAAITQSEPLVGEAMKRIDSRLRRRVRQRLGRP